MLEDEVLEQPEVHVEKDVVHIELPKTEKDLKLARLSYTKGVPNLRHTWGHYKKSGDATFLDEIREFKRNYFDMATALNDLEYATEYWDEKMNKYGIKL